MFNEYKQAFKDCADTIPNWENLTLTEICKKYREYKELNKWLAESYFSALVYKTWCKVEMLYRTTRFSFLSCYDIVIDAWMSIVNYSFWVDKDHPLFNDEEAAEKAFSTRIRTLKIMKYKEENMLCRYANIEAISLDQYLIDNKNEEMNRDDASLICIDNYNNEYVYDDLVKEFFKKKNYLAAIVIDMLSQGYGFENPPSYKHAKGYNKKELIYAIYKLDKQYCEYFSKRYGVDFIEVLDCLKYLFNCTNDKMDRNIKYTLRMLGRKQFSGKRSMLYN